eukprot:3062482-Amphidinium_carterae.1
MWYLFWRGCKHTDSRQVTTCWNPKVMWQHKGFPIDLQRLQPPIADSNGEFGMLTSKKFQNN